MNETAFNTSRFNQSALNASMLSGAGASRQAGFFPPGTPKAIREALVCWYDPARQGATNEKMAENPVLKDLSGNGHDAACRNFAWRGMSGIGLYRMKPRALTGLRCEAYEFGDYKYKCINVIQETWILHSATYALGLNDGDPVTVRITGLPEGAKLWFNTTGYITATKDGVYSGRYDKGTYGDGVQVSKEALGATITVEFLPEYPGALVSDGVDDYCVAEGLPILTDYTVIAKRKYISEKNGSLAKKDGDAMYGEFNMENRYNDTNTRTQSFISWNNLPDGFSNQNVTYQTRLSYNGTPIIGINGDTDGHSLLLVRGTNTALWSFLLFNRTLTAEEIEWVKANMVNGYPSPVAYYDCSKYTNEDMGDNPVLEDLSGNGNDLELHNFAFTAESGFDGNGGLVFDGVDDYGLIKSIEGFKTVFMLMVYCNNTNVYYNQQIYDHSGGANIPAFRVRYAFTNRLNVDDTDYLESYINGIKNIDTLTTLDCVAKKILVTNVSDRRLALNDGKIFPVTNSPCCILYKFLGFKERLTQKQMDKVIQDYGLMEGVDDVWNEQQ